MRTTVISLHVAETNPSTSNSGTVIVVVVVALIAAAVAAAVILIRRRRARDTAADAVEAVRRTAAEVAQPSPAPVPVAPSVMTAPPPASPPSSKMAVFLSYRREDSADVAGRIYDRLTQAFGEDQVFKDVDSIPLGVDFREYLQQVVGRCDVLLAVIGDQWFATAAAGEGSRLDDPKDFVRIELEGALQRGIPVIPVLVRGAAVPHGDELPSTLSTLAYRSGISVRADPDFHRDMDRLIDGIRHHVTNMT